MRSLAGAVAPFCDLYHPALAPCCRPPPAPPALLQHVHRNRRHRGYACGNGGLIIGRLRGSRQADCKSAGGNDGGSKDHRDALHKKGIGYSASVARALMRGAAVRNWRSAYSAPCLRSSFSMSGWLLVVASESAVEPSFALMSSCGWYSSSSFTTSVNPALDAAISDV